MVKKTGILWLLLANLVSYGQAINAGAGNGYTLAVARFGPVNTDLFVARADGSNPKPLLAHAEHDYNASFSSRGDWIVFTSERKGSADIYRVHPDGTGLESLVNHPAFDDQATLSPDGNFLAFVSSRSGQADIWVLNLKSKTLTNLTQHPGGDFRPCWSPDGQWIAFSSDRYSAKPKQNWVTLHSAELFMMRPDGSGLRRLTNDNAFAGSPSWSADGKKLVYYAGGIEEVRKITSALKRRGSCQIISLDIQTNQRQTLTQSTTEKWSPHYVSPETIAYTSGGPEGGIEFTSGVAGARGEFRCPSWSPDGRYLVFHREVDHHWPPVKKTYSLHKNFNVVRTGIFPSFSPSGDRLICNDQTAGILRNSVLIMNTDGSHSSVFLSDTARSVLAPAWSPQGDQIAFSLGRFFQQVHGQAVADLAIVDNTGKNLRILTDSSANYGFPSWSPDGKKVVVRASGRKNGLYILDVESRKISPLLTGYKNSNLPSWSPQGDRILFNSDQSGHYEIYSVRPDGTDVKQLTFQQSSVSHPVWSPDGQWIAFVSIIGGFKDEALLHPYSTEPSSDLYVMRADGTGVLRLTDDQHLEGTPAWMPLNQSGVASPGMK